MIAHYENGFFGDSFIFDDPAELDLQDPGLTSLVGPMMRDLFVHHPAPLASLAKQARFPPLRRWLEEMTRHGCQLGIHIAAEGISVGPYAVFLHVGPEEGESLTRPYYISGGVARVPSWCPPVLAETLTLVGEIAFAWDYSERLLPPAQQRTLRSLHEEFRVHCHDSWLDEIQLPDGGNGYHSFYCDGSGGWIATNRRGLTYHSGYQAGPPIEEWLTKFFDHRLRGGSSVSYSD